MPNPSRSAQASDAPAGSELSEDTAARVLRRFRVVFNAVKTHFRQVEKLAGIGGAQVWALSVIAGQPGIGVGELARALDIHQSTASNLVKSLLEAGLIEAQKGEEDRRAVRLTILAPGQHLLRLAPGPFTGVLPVALRSLDPATLSRLDSDLGKLIASLEADEDSGNVPLSQA